MLGSAPPDLGDDTIYIIPKSYDAFSRKSGMYWMVDTGFNSGIFTENNDGSRSAQENDVGFRALAMISLVTIRI